MSTQSCPDEHAMQISAKTQHILRDFVRTAVSRLSELLKDHAPAWEVDSRGERGTDGHFLEHKKGTRQVWSNLRDEWRRAIPDYDTCVKHLESDAVVGSHPNHLVGTNIGASGIEVDDILWSIIDAMLNEEGAFTFTDNRFDRKTRELFIAFELDWVTCKMVAPLPYL